MSAPYVTPTGISLDYLGTLVVSSVNELGGVPGIRRENYTRTEARGQFLNYADDLHICPPNCDHPGRFAPMPLGTPVGVLRVVQHVGYRPHSWSISEDRSTGTGDGPGRAIWLVWCGGCGSRFVTVSNRRGESNAARGAAPASCGCMTGRTSTLAAIHSRLVGGAIPYGSMEQEQPVTETVTLQDAARGLCPDPGSDEQLSRITPHGGHE